ncbi:thiolase domain-containing protein, partial [Streptomyces sp. NPDC059193]
MSTSGKEPVAVVGIGQTKHVAARHDVSIAGLVREAASRAHADARQTGAAHDPVGSGQAPPIFEGG